jgi:hypothetical protein
MGDSGNPDAFSQISEIDGVTKHPEQRLAMASRPVGWKRLRVPPNLPDDRVHLRTEAHSITFAPALQVPGSVIELGFSLFVNDDRLH